MTIRLSTAARNAMLGDNTNKGLQGVFAAGFLYIYSGTQPATADAAANGVQLGKVTISDDGTTGLQFELAAAGVLAKDTDEVWQFHGLTNGVAGWYRFTTAAGNPATADATQVRVDGLIGTAGADLNMTNTNIVTNAVTTIDAFDWTLPAS
jgi:hypothetical protein